MENDWKNQPSKSAAAEPALVRTPLPNPITSFDAMDWAKAFVAHVKQDPLIATDEGTMLAWFASAIMRGYDEHSYRAVAVPEPAAPPTLYCDVCDTELQREACDRVRPCVKCLKAEPAAQPRRFRNSTTCLDCGTIFESPDDYGKFQAHDCPTRARQATPSRPSDTEVLDYAAWKFAKDNLELSRFTAISDFKAYTLERWRAEASAQGGK
jgi:hypothetical protein